MAVTEGNYVTSPIENATMRELLNNGVLYKYRIQAVDGYVLHDNRVDVEELDPETLEPTGNIIPWFKFGSTSVPLTYDFDNVTEGTYTYTDENGMSVTIPVSKIGMYEFYTLPASIVPTNQICEVENTHEKA